MSTNALERGRAAFLEEAKDLLEELEESLLELENHPDDAELIGRIFRAMHTIKGSGGMFGFTRVESFTHDIETAFDKVREGILAVSQDLIDVTLKARDIISRLLFEPGSEDDADLKHQEEDVLNAFSGFAGSSGSGPGPKTAEAQHVPAAKGSPDTTFLIRIVPDEYICSRGTNPLLLLDELQELGTAGIVAHTDRLPALKDVVPEKCFLYWDVLLTTAHDENEIHDIFIFVEDECELTIQLLDRQGLIRPETDFPVLIEKIKAGSGVDAAAVKALIKDRTPAAPQTRTAGGGNDVPEQADVESKVQLKKMEVTSIRVAAEKLDQLVNLVGELVIVQASLSQRVTAVQDADLLPIAEEVERLTRDLRDTAMNIRMVPIGTLFNKFKRVVRDLSHEQGKNIIFETKGDDTELDKNVIEQLNDPMMHLIRNSVDHGIEPAAMRLVSGKRKEGKIVLSAFHSGADVVIRVTDDGKGLNTDVIRKKAVERGIINADAKLTDQEIYRLIFEPGFSTAAKVTAVSGRGVGMDVVRRNIEEMRGSISVESGKAKGTSITLRLPLTLGIIEGLLVRIGEDHFVLPLLSVEDCLERPGGSSRTRQHLHTVNVRGEVVPVLPLRAEFGIDGDVPGIEHIVISRVGEERVGFVVDEIIGEQQVVIKNLGRMYRDVEGLSGATILGDGNVALILDVQRLVEKAYEAEEARLLKVSAAGHEGEGI